MKQKPAIGSVVEFYGVPRDDTSEYFGGGSVTNVGIYIGWNIALVGKKLLRMNLERPVKTIEGPSKQTIQKAESLKQRIDEKYRKQEEFRKDKEQRDSQAFRLVQRVLLKNGFTKSGLRFEVEGTYESLGQKLVKFTKDLEALGYKFGATEATHQRDNFPTISWTRKVSGKNVTLWVYLVY